MIKKVSKTTWIIIVIICCFFFQTSAYSILNSSLVITGNAYARIHNNVRINDFKIHEVSDGVISSYEEFSKTTTNSNVTLPNSDSYIIYKLIIGNYENVEMQLSNITGLSSNLTYELIDYTLHDMICDSSNKCVSGAEKTIYLKIKYASYDSLNTNYNVNLNYQFSEFSNVLMIGSEFKNTIPSTATHLVFTDEKPAQGTILTDVSAAKDMGVVGYLDGTTYKVSTRRTGYMPEANTDSSYMFNGALLTNIDLDNLDISSTTNIIGMFQDCTSLVNINFGSDWDTSNITEMKYLFKNCSSLPTIDLSGFNTSKVISFSNFFNGCSSLTSLDVSGLNTSNATSFESMFNGCSLLEFIDVSGFDTGNVVNMSLMFYKMKSLISLDVTNFDTQNVTSMESMFSGLNSVTVLDLSNFSTENVKNYGMYGMFSGMKSLETIDISNFNTSRIKRMDWMFNGCRSLEEINVSSFDTSSVTSMSGMFSGMHKLQSLDILNFNTSNVTDMGNMFEGLMVVTELNLTNFDTSNVTNMINMFYNCNNMGKIYIGDQWDTKNVTNSLDMFYKCVNLPNYDSNVIDVSKAYVGDGGYLSYSQYIFYVDDVSYQYEDGMTWSEWIESDYNVDCFKTVSSLSDYSVLVHEDMFLLPEKDETILFGKKYIFISYYPSPVFAPIYIVRGTCT